MSHLQILVDSKEQSISAARQYLSSQPSELKIDVQHTRHADFKKAFTELFNLAGSQNRILICMDYLGEKLPKISVKNGAKSGTPKVTVISYCCSDQFKKWFEAQELTQDQLKDLCNDQEPTIEQIKKWFEAQEFTQDQLKDLCNDQELTIEQIKKWFEAQELTQDQLKDLCNDQEPTIGQIKKWFKNRGVTYKENPYRRRNLPSHLEEKYYKIVSLNECAEETPEPNDSEKTKEQDALERIVTQYRLIRAIVSRGPSLREVAKSLLRLKKNASKLDCESIRAIRHHLLKEPDMVGGTYIGEGKSGQNTDNPIDELRERIKKIAATDFNVLIEGESGSGKEGVAWFIHDLSGRKDKPFYTINCAAFTDELLESSLFGHVKGAFSGAYKNHVGIMKEADGGTIFLDELPDMGPRFQAKLLRLLETGEYRRVGQEGINKSVDVRIIAAGQGHLLNDSARIRGDLKARISELTVKLLPLREIIEKSPRTLTKISNALLERFTWKTIDQEGDIHVLTPKDIRERKDMLKDPQKQKLLTEVKWQESNVRELKNFICHWLALGSGEFDRLADNLSKTEGDLIENGNNFVNGKAQVPLNPLAKLENAEDLDDFKKILESLSGKRYIANNAKNIYRCYLLALAKDIRTKGIVNMPKITELVKNLDVTDRTFGKYLK